MEMLFLHSINKGPCEYGVSGLTMVQTGIDKDTNPVENHGVGKSEANYTAESTETAIPESGCPGLLSSATAFSPCDSFTHYSNKARTLFFNSTQT